MSFKNEQICRFCLKVVENEFRKINKLVKQMLDVLLLRMDLDTRDPVICNDCVKVAKKCLIFKSTCMNIEKIILSFSISREKTKHNIKVIYEGVHLETVDEDIDLCRFCMNQSKRNNLIDLDLLINEAMVEMLSKYMPELDINTIENPVICKNCRQYLEVYFKFIMNYLSIENKIKVCCKEEIDNIDQIKLDKFSQISAIKDISNTLKDTEVVCSDAFSRTIKLEQWDIKSEEINFEENSYGNLSEIGSDIYGDSVPCKEDEKDSKLGIVSLNTEHSTDISKSQKEVDMSIKETLFHDNASEAIIYKCSSCAYEGKRKDDFTKHMLVHNDTPEIKVYKYNFETKDKGNLRVYFLDLDKDTSEIKRYKCTICPYEAEKRSTFEKHMLAHKDVSKVTLHKCSFCIFDTKYKSNLKQHVKLVHMNISELKTYECSLCPYKTKQKSNLNRHRIIHNDVSELKLYKCSLCTFETKHQRSLKCHMLTHRDVSKVETYKCSLCSYEGTRKSYLRNHMLTHMGKDV